MDTATISLFLAIGVGLIQVLGYLHTRAASKEMSLEKFAQASSVSSELTVIRDDIDDIIVSIHDHGAKISALQTQSAVLISQMTAQIKELEKLSDKLDDWK